ncbi:MAG: Eco57I restriction-modification methylase domain-containing protein, partial [Anaerolineales bacterium]
MADPHTQRVYDLLKQISREGLDAVKRLFWSELNYDRVDEPLSTRAWPGGALAVVAGAPVLLARHDSPSGSFDVVHVTLAPGARGRNFPLSSGAERTVVQQLLADHPYALFLFSDVAGRHWHFVNVKYRRENGAEAGARAVIRRITVGPQERLRTAAERIALLDLEMLSPDLAGLSPLAIQARHDEAFDVERVTRDFFSTYRRLFEQAEEAIAGIGDEEALRLFTQRLFNRLLFIVFLERKGWLTFAGRTDYLRALWEDYLGARESDAAANFYNERLKVLFFEGLNNPGERDLMSVKRQGVLQGLIGDVPYLNGGLFERESLDDREGIVVPDAIFREALDALLYHYNFTVTESTPLDVEVAVDPEMLGRIFEELVTGRHESGSYYTPKPEVAFMCREALKGYLKDTCPRESEGALAAFVDERDAGGLHDAEGVLRALQRVRVCDPACGSGAYLVGMLHELVELRQALFATRSLDARSAYDRKLQIIQHNLYGVDIDPFAVNIARLRLWLSLIVDFEGEVPPPLPNLAYKIEVGDSLTAPAPAQLQPDLFHHQLVQDYFALKGRFMTAHGPQKQELKERIAEVQAEIAEWAGTAGDPEAFDWTVEFAEIFTAPGESVATLTGGMTGVVNAGGGQLQLAAREGREPGFDIIVANPPYVRMELIKELKERFKTLYSEVYWGTADLYVYFYARALHLLREGGIASIISSNKWLRAGYG